jgi:hypothetical protein
MTHEETRKLLRFIAAVDGRKVTRDTVHAWNQLLSAWTYAEAKAAAETAIKNSAGKYLEIGLIIAVLRGEPLTRPTSGCDHGVPRGQYCHDCTHDPDNSAAAAREIRTHGVVYPGETTCPWGHTIDHAIVDARRRAHRLPTCQDCVP